MYPYDIEQLAEKAGVSKTSIYNLIGKNKSFVKDNSTKRQRKVYYNQAVLDWLLEQHARATVTVILFPTGARAMA